MPPNTRREPKPIRPFAVAFQTSQTVNFVVDARTAEEAEAIATEWLEDGETGTVTDLEIHDCDAFPTEDDSIDAPLNRPRFSLTDTELDS